MLKRRRITALVAIGLLLALLYGKNLLERGSFRSISGTFTEVYDERLLAESYIFQISEKLFRIQQLVDHCDINYDYTQVVEEISAEEQAILTLLSGFEATHLSEAEAALLSDFRGIIEKDLNIKAAQLLYSDSFGINTEQVKIYDQKIARAQQDLVNLSKIQLAEGKKLVTKAKTLINRSQIWAQFELALLFILVLVIYLYIFKKPLFEEQED